MAATLEQVLDKIADALIKSGEFSPEDIRDNQKTIRNGIKVLGRANSEKLLLFETDEKANQEDLSQAIIKELSEGSFVDTGLTSLQAIIGHCTDDSSVEIDSQSSIGTGGSYISNIYLRCDGGEWNITNLVQNNMEGYNVSQFMNLIQSGSNVDPTQANEFLNTNIYELLPQEKTRQQRINELFAEIETLKAKPPGFHSDPITTDLEIDPTYEANNDISYAQECIGEGCPDEEEAFITRLNIDANDVNTNKTIESLRNTLNEYLKDIDQVIEAEIEDERPEYKEKSDGYLKIRNLNQGIIIRKQEGDDIGIENTISITDNDTHPHNNQTGPSYLMDGFTISM
jgi:hypothetical protein